jgi:hypothetical protein
MGADFYQNPPDRHLYTKIRKVELAALKKIEKRELRTQKQNLRLRDLLRFAVQYVDQASSNTNSEDELCLCVQWLQAVRSEGIE